MQYESFISNSRITGSQGGLVGTIRAYSEYDRTSTAIKGPFPIRVVADSLLLIDVFLMYIQTIVVIHQMKYNASMKFRIGPFPTFYLF